MKLFILLLLFPLSIIAQTANVVQLSPALAARAQRIHAKQVILNRELEQLRVDIIHEHLEAPLSQKAGCVVRQMLVLEGWGCGEFNYDPTFSFIVPASTLTSAPYESNIYTLENGKTIPLLDKDLEQDDGKWIYNNTPNSETNPNGAHKYGEDGTGTKQNRAFLYQNIYGSTPVVLYGGYH